MDCFHTDVIELQNAHDRRVFVRHAIEAVARIDGASLATLFWRNKNGSHAGKTGSHTCTLEFSVPGKLNCLLLVSNGSIPLIHWVSRDKKLAAVAKAWEAWHINQFHGCKATSFPSTTNAAIEAIVCGLSAAIDGSAFKSSQKEFA